VFHLTIKTLLMKSIKIKSIDEIKFNGPKDKIQILGNEIDEIYTDKIKKLSLSPEAIAKNSDMKIVYTPLHGTGVKLGTNDTAKNGVSQHYNIYLSRNISDGNFSTIKSPNPEEPAALNMAIEKSQSDRRRSCNGNRP